MNIEEELKKAESGDIDAMFNIGLCFFQGTDGVAIDYKRSAKWFELAASQGHVEAKSYLEWHYATVNSETDSAKLPLETNKLRLVEEKFKEAISVPENQDELIVKAPSLSHERIRKATTFMLCTKDEDRFVLFRDNSLHIEVGCLYDGYEFHGKYDFTERDQYMGEVHYLNRTNLTIEDLDCFSTEKARIPIPDNIKSLVHKYARKFGTLYLSYYSYFMDIVYANLYPSEREYNLDSISVVRVKDKLLKYDADNDVVVDKMTVGSDCQINREDIDSGYVVVGVYYTGVNNGIYKADNSSLNSLNNAKDIFEVRRPLKGFPFKSPSIVFHKRNGIWRAWHKFGAALFSNEWI